MKPFAFHAATPDFIHKDGDYHLTLRVPIGTVLEATWIRSEPDNEEFMSPMTHRGDVGAWSLWEGVLHPNPAEDVTLYAFKFLIDNRQYWLGSTGVTHYEPEREEHFHFNPHYQPARWVWASVFYQIFPDRFYDGDPTNNVQDGEYLYAGKPVVAKRWGELPDPKQGAREFYGGDLQGVREKLPYLEQLGITALYLNPVFTSPSSHKYDTVDYFNVDPHFGGNEALADLCAALRKRNMHILLDAVVNHTSERHPWFDRYGEHPEAGAYRSKDAPSRKFYVFGSDDPDSYHGWYGVKTLPVLDYRSEELRRIVYESDDSILRRWLRGPYRIDGWRFDVIHMLGEGTGAQGNAEYVRHFRRTLREENRSAYMLGEHFFEATRWLQGDQEDGAMNYYGFTKPLRAFLARSDGKGHRIDIDAQDFDYLLGRARGRIPFEIALSQFNLLDSHDTPRFLTILNGDKALMRMAVTILFTYTGVPCVYYGDEVGLEGDRDPDCRRTFPWDEREWDKGLLEHYRRLIALRKERRVLQEGAFVNLYAEGDVYAFARVLGDEAVVTVLNRGKEAEVTLPLWKLGLGEGRLESFFSGERLEYSGGELGLRLEAKSSLVLL